MMMMILKTCSTHFIHIYFVLSIFFSKSALTKPYFSIYISPIQKSSLLRHDVILLLLLTLYQLLMQCPPVNYHYAIIYHNYFLFCHILLLSLVSSFIYPYHYDFLWYHYESQQTNVAGLLDHVGARGGGQAGRTLWRSGGEAVLHPPPRPPRLTASKLRYAVTIFFLFLFSEQVCFRLIYSPYYFYYYIPFIYFYTFPYISTNFHLSKYFSLQCLHIYS